MSESITLASALAAIIWAVAIIAVAVLLCKRGVLKRLKVRVFCQRPDGSQVDVFVGEASRDRTLLKYPSDSVKRVFALEKTTEAAPGIAQLTVAEGWLDFCGKPENRHTQLVLNLDV